VTFEECMQSVFGYPNDEGYWHDPRGEAGDRPGYGFFEIVGSTWPGRLIAYNRNAFPDPAPPHYAALRHYFIGCHDASGEFLTADMKIELTSGSYGQAAHEAIQRTAGPLVCPPGPGAAATASMSPYAPTTTSMEHSCCWIFWTGCLELPTGYSTTGHPADSGP
jgi:hypothetical protein